MPHSRAIRSGLAMLALAFAALSSTGCAVLNFGEVGHEGGDATLGQAAAMAADSANTKKDRPLDVGYTTPPVVATEVGVAAAEPLAPGGEVQPGIPLQKEAPNPFRRPVFGLGLNLGTFGGDSYDGFGGLAISGGGYPDDQLRIDLILRADGVDFNGQSLLGQALVDAMDFKLEVMARYELTKGWTFMSLYPVLGLGTGTLFWNYAKPVPVVEDGVVRYVNDDHINHFYGYLGLGFAGLRTRHVLLDVIASGGGRIYGWHTYNGFSNDLLPSVGFAQVQFELAFR